MCDILAALLVLYLYFWDFRVVFSFFVLFLFYCCSAQSWQSLLTVLYFVLFRFVCEQWL